MPMPTLPWREARVHGARPLPGVRAGSALAWRGDRLAVIQDDAFAVALVDPTGARAPELVALRGDGHELAKPLKPDFEAAFAAADGALWLVGSGSKPNRTTWARVDGAAVAFHDVSPLYAAIADVLGHASNLEGAVLAGDTLRLLHRAEGQGEGACAILEVPWDGAPPTRVAACRRLTLGRLAGVALTFTDAALGPAGLYFTAVAEDTPTAYDDGPIVGAAVGLVVGDGLAWTPLLDEAGAPLIAKVEGLALDADGRGGWVVTDPDDPAIPASLARLTLA